MDFLHSVNYIIFKNVANHKIDCNTKRGANMTEKERVELEVCVDVLNSLIADFHIIASKHNIPLDKDDNVGVSYRKVVKYVNHLRRTTSYEDVIAAKRNIATIRSRLVRLEVERDV